MLEECGGGPLVSILHRHYSYYVDTLALCRLSYYVDTLSLFRLNYYVETLSLFRLNYYEAPWYGIG